MSVLVVRADCFSWVRDNLEMGTVPLIVTDPPYGGILKHEWDKRWAMADYWQLTELIRDLLMPGGTAYVWGGIGKPGNRLFFQWLGELEQRMPGLLIWDVITWSKRRAYGTTHRYLFTREECVMLVKGGKPATFNVPLLEEKRGYAGFNKDYPAKSEFKRVTNVWTDITELFRGKIHDAEKPAALAKRMISTSSNPGDLVLDLFAGSGSTGLAAYELERECILIERSNCQMHFVEE